VPGLDLERAKAGTASKIKAIEKQVNELVKAAG